MAEKFTDADGNEVKLITKENVEDFKNWINTTQDPDFISVEVSPELKLTDIIPPNTRFGDTKQQVAAGVVVQAMKASATPEKCAEFISLASTTDTNRGIIGRAWQSIGNRTSNEFHYQEIANAIKNTPDSKLIGFNLACIKYKCFTETGKTDDGKKLTNREKELLSLLAENTSGKNVINKFVENGSLINANTENNMARKAIDEAIINNGINNVFTNLDLKFINKEMLKEQLKATYRFDKTNTSKAKTQAEKNANILPKKYTRLQDAFMHLTEKQEKHDSSDWGRIKGLHERFLDLCKDMGITSELDNNPILREISMQIATRDVLNGNIEKLNDNILAKIIAADKSNEIVNKLPNSFIEAHKDVLLKNSPYLKLRDSVLNNLDSSWAIPAIAETKNVSLALKEKILAEAEKANAARAPEKETLKNNISAHLNEATKASAFYNQNRNRVSDAQHAVEEISRAYQNIKNLLKTDKNGQLLASEAFLSAENVSKLLVGDNPQLPSPQQGSLPLLGRGTEKNRRKSLDEAISAFNQMVHVHMPTLNQEVYDKNSNNSLSSVKKLLGDNILTDKAPSLLRGSEQDCLKDFSKIRDGLDQKYGRYEAKQSALEIMEKTDKLLIQARTDLNNAKAALKEAAHELSGVKAAEEQSKLQVVDNNLEGKEKAAVRKANKAIVDPLAQKQDAKTVLKIAKQKQTSR